MSKVYVIVATNEEGWEPCNKHEFSGATRAKSALRQILSYYGVEELTESIANEYTNNGGIGYDTFEDLGGWDYIVGMVTEEKLSELLKVLDDKRNKLFNK